MYRLTSFLLMSFVVGVTMLPVLVDGQIRSSTNYKIERDSVNIGGGLGTSTNYNVESTVGEIATGRSTSTNYLLDAGYQQLGEEEYISISSPSNINMDPINGLIGGVSTSSIAWTVTTNSGAGYTASVKASTSPALKSPLDVFVDYVPATSDPDYVWSIVASAAEFGYSVLGTDTAQRFKDNGVSCNISTGNVAERCWDGFSTSDETIAQRASSNDPSGTLTTLELRAEAGADRMLTADDYTATITVTAVAL